MCRPLVALLLVGQLPALCAEPNPLFKLDLRTIGYRVTGQNRRLADYTDLAFLSDTLLLISINEMKLSFGGSPNDRPDSRIVLIDLSVGRVTGELRTTVAQRSGSVQALSGQRFAVFNNDVVQVCNRDLTCGSDIQSPGPLKVSPRGKTIAVGGNGRTPTRVIDSVILKSIGTFPFPAGYGSQSVSPGDAGIIIDRGPRVALRRTSGKPNPGDSPIDILEPRKITMQQADGKVTELALDAKKRALRFLSDEYVGYFDNETSTAVVAGLNAEPKYEYRVEDPLKSESIPCLSGTGVGIYEHGYTSLDSMINFLDIDHGRPENFERLRIFDLSSGSEKANFEWDPQSYPIKPALSHSGTRIARIRDGFLEVLQVN
jgi:hypothetical protein